MLPIVFFPYSDKNMPSSYYRVYRMESQLRSKGWQTRIIKANLTDAQKRIELDTIEQRSIIYIQKAGNSFHIPENFMPYRDKHILVFDIDDYIDSPIMEAMMECCHAVICGSHYLFDHAKLCTENTHLLPCSIDDTFFAPVAHRLDGPPRVVWSHCFADVYAEDLLSIAQPLRNVFKRKTFELYLCGFRNIENDNIKQKIQHELPFATCIDYQPVDDFTQKTLPLIQQADIALVPFKDTPQRRSKAGLTLRNYMAMNIPTIASPVGEHCYIIDHYENGFLASTPTDWEEYLTNLLSNKRIRNSIGKQARKSVIEHYSINTTADKLDTILREIAQIDIKPTATTHRRANNCAVILGRINPDSEDASVAQQMIKKRTALYYIQQMLKNTGVIDRVIFAMPDDDIHRKFSSSIRSKDIEIKLGNPDDPAKRVLELCPDDCGTLFKFVLEKPFADMHTLSHTASLLRTKADIVRVHDPDWGIAFEAMNRKAVTYRKLHNNHPLRHCDGFFLGKPMFDPVSISIDTYHKIQLFRDYIDTYKKYTIEQFQDFVMQTKKVDQIGFYTAMQSQKSENNQNGPACIIIDKSIQKNEFQSFLNTLPYQSAILCLHEDCSPDKLGNQPYIQVLAHDNITFDELEIAVEQGYRFSEEFHPRAVYSLSTRTAVYAVRLANRLRCPVTCYLSDPIDPADRILKHHLAMADALYPKADIKPHQHSRQQILSQQRL